MIIANKKLEKAYSFCSLLKIECIKREIEQQLEGYTFKSIEMNDGKFLAHFRGMSDEKLTLMFSFNRISMMKNSSSGVERISIDENMLLTDRIMDKRPNGIVYSVIKKRFLPSHEFNQIVLNDLVEKRYTFTNDEFDRFGKNVNFTNSRFNNLFLRLRMLETGGYLKTQCDFYSEFSTHMNSSIDSDELGKEKSDIYPTKTYFNGEDVSNIFVLDGPDNLYRIFDLYNGMINPQNEDDIISINLGSLSQDVFNFKDLRGVTSNEDSLVGPTSSSVSSSYIDYITKLFARKFGYSGDVGLDRDSMLLGITYQMSWLDAERQKLIEQKKSKGSIDITDVDAINQGVDKSNDNGPKKVLKRLLKSFNKK